MLWVRHGETAANRDRLALGRANPPLTDRGQDQARALGVRLMDSGAVRVISSPLLRARLTASAIADPMGVDVEVDDRLIELDYGEWDQRSFSEFPPEDLAHWRRDATFAPPGGESLIAVGKRVSALCAEMIDGPPVVVVSHVSPIKAAVIWAMGGDPLLAWRIHLDVASISRIGAPNRVPCVLGVNDTAHLL